MAADEIGFRIVCDEIIVDGAISTSDADQTVLSAQVIDKHWVSSSLTIDSSSSAHEIPVDSSAYDQWWYEVVVSADYNGQTIKNSYPMYLWDEVCDSAAAVKERVVVYADEANDYFENTEAVQELPTRFLNTGIGAWVEKAMAATQQRFALASSPVHHDIPEWTVDPFSTQYPTFEEHYAMLPNAHRDATAYIQFEWMLIPIVLPNWDETENELLALLDNGALLAPETPSLNTIGAVKMIYTHSLSLVKSPFAGVGSFLSVFAQEGDTFTFYVKNGFVSYDKREYIMVSRLQIRPEQTGVITSYKKDGADTIAMITCKDGDVLGSTLGREVLFLERKAEELGSLQKSLVWIDGIPTLEAQKRKFDQYLKSQDLSDEAVVQMVKKLEQVESDTGNPLKVIATYGKYMASYDALYNG